MISGFVVDQRHSPISNAEGRIVDVIQLSRTPELGPDTMCCSCGLHGCRFRDMPQLPTLRRARSLDRGDRMEASAIGACLTFWIIIDGMAASCLGFEDGRRQILSLERPGDVVCAPMAGGPTHTWLEALSECEVCLLDLSAHAELVRGDPAFLTSTFRIVHRRLARCQEHLATIGRLDSQERVTFFLAEMAANSTTPVVSLPMSREDIADYLGLNSETVSRILSRLKKTGLVKFLSHTDYVIPDLAALQRRLPVPVPETPPEATP